MGCLSITRPSLVCLVASAAVWTTKHATGFLSPPHVAAPTRQFRAALPKMCEKLNRPATTRSSLLQEVSVIAGAVATTGSVMVGAAAEAEARAPVTTTTSAGVVTEEDRKGVEETTIIWKNTVTLGTPDAPKQTASLYALDGVLWGTVSEEVRDTPEEIYDYFDYFARLPKLRLSEYTPVSVRVYGDFATQAGTYTFAWQGEDGQTKEKRARFSFTFRRDANSPTGWTIVEHHSSAMPTSPVELKRARNDVF